MIITYKQNNHIRTLYCSKDKVIEVCQLLQRLDYKDITTTQGKRK